MIAWPHRKTETTIIRFQLHLVILLISSAAGCSENNYTDPMELSITSGDPSPASASIKYRQRVIYEGTKEFQVRVVLRQISQFEYVNGGALVVDGVLESVEVSGGPRIEVEAVENSIAGDLDHKYSLDLSPERILDIGISRREVNMISKRPPRHDGLYWSEIGSVNDDGQSEKVVAVFMFVESGSMRFALTSGNAIAAATWIGSAPQANDGEYEFAHSTLHLRLGDSIHSPYHEAHVDDDGNSIEILSGGFAGEYAFLESKGNE